MRRTLLAVGMCLVFGLTFGVAAQQKPPESYETLMKSMQAHTGRMFMAIRAKDNAKIETNATALKGLFAQVEKFWTERKAEDAVKDARTGANAAETIAAAAKAGDTAKMMSARRTLIVGSCKTCHTAHRAKMANGKWGIK